MEREAGNDQRRLKQHCVLSGNMKVCPDNKFSAAFFFSFLKDGNKRRPRDKGMCLLNLYGVWHCFIIEQIGLCKAGHSMIRKTWVYCIMRI